MPKNYTLPTAAIRLSINALTFTTLVIPKLVVSYRWLTTNMTTTISSTFYTVQFFMTNSSVEVVLNLKFTQAKHITTDDTLSQRIK